MTCTRVELQPRESKRQLTLLPKVKIVAYLRGNCALSGISRLEPCPQGNCAIAQWNCDFPKKQEKMVDRQSTSGTLTPNVEGCARHSWRVARDSLYIRDDVMSRLIRLVIVALVLGLASCNVVLADPFSISDTVTFLGGGLWQYDYKVTVDTNANAFEDFLTSIPPDFFAVGDFIGYVAGSQFVKLDGVLDPNWSFSLVANQTLQDPGGGPAILIGTPGVSDLVWTTTVPQPALTTGMRVFDFFATSTSPPKDGFAGSNYHNRPGQTLAVTKSSVDVPFAPEPWNVVSVIATMVPVGLLYFGLRRGKKTTD